MNLKLQDLLCESGYYKGWIIKYWPVGSQHWKATQHGVSINSNSEESLKKMIDAKIYEKHKNSLVELDEPDPLRTQIYLDMDGVLVNMDEGFKKLSGGYTTKTFKTAPQFNGDERASKRQFWKLINGTPGFWENLKPMPDAMVLWNYIKRKFTDPKPIILSAGQGSAIQAGKTKWVQQHLGPDVQFMMADMGSRKPNYIVKQPNTRYVLIDDTQRNVDAWNNPEEHRFAILHKNAAETIRLLDELTK